MNKVSIIIPVYNAEEHIRRCIESVLLQKIENYEILIINDGSIDKSEEIIKEYVNKYDKVKYYSKENSGVADTRNFGIKEATGKYILFLDGDDYIDKNLLADLQKYIDEDIDLIKFKLKKVDLKGNEIEKIDGPIFNKISGEDGFNKLYATDVLLDSPCLYLIKKELFIKNNLWFKINTYHEDFGLIPLIILKAKKMVSINKYYYNYVQCDNSIVRNNDYSKTLKRVYDTLIHYDNMLDYLENNDFNKKTKENMKSYYTNAIILKTEELNKNDQKNFIKEIKKRHMLQNIKVKNIKQLFKKLLLLIDVRLYLKLKG